MHFTWRRWNGFGTRIPYMTLVGQPSSSQQSNGKSAMENRRGAFSTINVSLFSLKLLWETGLNEHNLDMSFRSTKCDDDDDRNLG